MELMTLRRKSFETNELLETFPACTHIITFTHYRNEGLFACAGDIIMSPKSFGAVVKVERYFSPIRKVVWDNVFAIHLFNEFF